MVRQQRSSFQPLQHCCPRQRWQEKRIMPRRAFFFPVSYRMLVAYPVFRNYSLKVGPDDFVLIPVLVNGTKGLARRTRPCRDLLAYARGCWSHSSVSVLLPCSLRLPRCGPYSYSGGSLS